MKNCVDVVTLQYQYPQRKSNYHSDTVLVEGECRICSLHVERLQVNAGELVLCCGVNGAGKSTLLSVLGGRKLISRGRVTIFGRDAFNDCKLSNIVCYIGDRWTDHFVDMTIAEFVGQAVCKGERYQELCKILQVKSDWRVSQLSDGQRRRCQIISSFTSSDTYLVYILDETTSDLDIVSREKLLRWLKNEAVSKGACVLYATHILDGLDEWASRILYVEDGKISHDVPVTVGMDVYRTVRGWMLSSHNNG
jgi:CCR4-NOT complex subunit CAF16